MIRPVGAARTINMARAGHGRGAGMSYQGELDTRLLRLSTSDYFTLRDACQGVHIFGGIGSGKTSGSGAALAGAYLRASFGGLVLAAKPDEVELWLRYAQAHGRSNSVLLFGGAGGGFNFIRYELARQGADGIGSVIECLMRILEAARLAKASPGTESGSFWEDTSRQLLRNTIPILFAATGDVRIPDILRFIVAAPVTQDQLRDPDWQERSFMFQALLAARRSPMHPLSQDDFDKTARYWRDEYAQLDPKTRGNIAISLSTALDRFNRGRLQAAFCGETTLMPELSFHGAIIIMDMSALTWNEDGIVGQQLFKFMWQRAVLARNALAPQQRERPVFLWADESQYFVNSFDADFQSTCRSSRACTVYLTQSLPTYYAKIGGHDAKHRADMLLANFVTKIFHNNADPETNRWAAETIGRSLQRRATFSQGSSWGHNMGMSDGESANWNRSSNVGGASGRHGGSSSYSSQSSHGEGENWGRSQGLNNGGSASDGYSETMDYEIEPAAFSRQLLTGGRTNGNHVTGIWFQAGKRFNDSARNYLHVQFDQ
ncbi:TraG/TraD/VirD4 family protein [Sphingomonas sp. CBMAI 2297]|uniref:type IV secretory system conjugative DNA transfer family protein n=1 Tax=Sphingomonas sp. CBMAI 2297 TaxID=2991720 RepID=UPI0024553109|nr:TraM recognition domain-containing protein [Sphingomonas sp. CBMAI 2297]MDH4745875.1 TraG/TraD/VirD4 family protein [Sphingomonas sp. CBMAI 2297]